MNQPPGQGNRNAADPTVSNGNQDNVRDEETDDSNDDVINQFPADEVGQHRHPLPRWPNRNWPVANVNQAQIPPSEEGDGQQRNEEATQQGPQQVAEDTSGPATAERTVEAVGSPSTVNPDLPSSSGTHAALQSYDSGMESDKTDSPSFHPADSSSCSESSSVNVLLRRRRRRVETETDTDSDADVEPIPLAEAIDEEPNENEPVFDESQEDPELPTSPAKMGGLPPDCQ